jgi:hypothetical protein
MNLTSTQQAIISAPLDAKIFLRGIAGSGKTTTAVRRVIALIENGVPADSILILTPQRTLQDPYTSALLDQNFAGGEVTPATAGGLARRMVDLFWAVCAERAGFHQPDQPPTFLTMETAQYYMAHIVRPKLADGFFASLTIDRNRLYAQIIDNLNKAAFVGFDHREIGERLTAAWIGDPAQRNIYADAQECASAFRSFCLEHNLLDFSLQSEIFFNILWKDEWVRSYLTGTYRHLIYDNAEEDVPIAHDLIEEWLPHFDSALIVADEGAGFRKFLGADPLSAMRFESLMDNAYLDRTFVQSADVQTLEALLVNGIDPSQQNFIGEGSARHAFQIERTNFYPELLDVVVREVQRLIHDEGIPPEEIAITAPYLSDSLRFSIMNRLEASAIPSRSNRPSRTLRDEPASQTLITLAMLAHPDWNFQPTKFDVAYALTFALHIDLIRAQLLTEIVYRVKDSRLSPFDEIKPEVQERITYSAGDRYSRLREWIDEYRAQTPLPFDHFLGKLFGEIISQPGFGFNENIDAAQTAASLIESAKKFRMAMMPINAGFELLGNLGREYILMLKEGVIAAQFLQPYQANENAVLVAPATTFLMMNRPVRFQFWLDAGSQGWSERLFQPLTHPVVLSRNWQMGRSWTDADEVASSAQALIQLTSGLLRRCSERIYLGLTDLGESGFEQRGGLLRAFQKVLQETQVEK